MDTAASSLGAIQDSNWIDGDGGRLYLVDTFGRPPQTVAIDEQTGAELWRSPMGPNSEQFGLDADGGLVFRTPADDVDGNIEALEGATGQRRWRSDAVHFAYTGWGTGDGNLAMLERAGRRVLWGRTRRARLRRICIVDPRRRVECIRMPPITRGAAPAPGRPPAA